LALFKKGAFSGGFKPEKTPSKKGAFSGGFKPEKTPSTPISNGIAMRFSCKINYTPERRGNQKQVMGERENPGGLKLRTAFCVYFFCSLC
jgi:hypothetical protein